MNKNTVSILLSVFSILLCSIFLSALVSATTSTSTITYVLHNESDSQYTNYLKLINSTADVANVKSDTVNMNNVGVFCYSKTGYPNLIWLPPNFTAQTWVNGTWNFNISYERVSGGGVAIAYLFGRILKVNGTSPGTLTYIRNTTNSADVGSITSLTPVTWSDTLPYSSDVNLSVGERIGVQICINITSGGSGGKVSNIDWELTSPSNVIFPNASITDTNPPTFLNNASQFVTTYTSTGYSNFSVTWSDDSSSLFGASLESNFTGSLQNISMPGSYPTYTYNTTPLAAGTYRYRFVANDSAGNSNGTAVLTFTINKATLTAGSLSTPTVTYPTSLTATATKGNSAGDADVAYRIYCGNNLIASATGSSPSGSSQLSAASYSCVFNTTAGPFSNFTSSASLATSTGTVNKGALTGSISGSTVVYPSNTVATATASNSGASDVNYTLYRNNTGLVNFSTTNGTAPAGETVLLDAGAYLYVLNTSGGTNWTANSSIATASITVSKGILNGTITGSSVTYPSAVSIIPSESGNSVGTDVNYTFWRNTSSSGTLVSSAINSNPSSDTTQLGAGTYSWILNSTGGTNWTSNSSIKIATFSVNQNSTNPVDIYLTNSTGTFKNQNITIGTANQTTANVTAVYSQSGTVSLYEDGASVSNLRTTNLSIGTHSYKGNITGNANYTSNITGATYYIIVLDTIPPIITLNLPANASASMPQNITFNFTATDNFASSMSCSIYIDNVLNLTNSSTFNNTLTNFNVVNIPEGSHQWNVSCTDPSGNLNFSSTRNFIVNVTPILTSISATPSLVKGGSSMYISPSGVADPQNDSLYYFCSEASTTPNSSNNICSGNNGTTYFSPYSTMNCSFTTATNDASHTVYCRVYDGTYYSTVKNTTYTTDSTPSTLSTISVAGDTISPYYDNVNDGWTNITVGGEASMLCRWEDQDHSYSNMPGDAAHNCSVSGTQATCSPQNLIQSLTTNLYVSCMDSLGNENNATNNLDISVVIDWTAPTTTDNSSTSIAVPPYVINITESDNLYGTASITTKYCTDTVGTCTPNTEIDNGGTVTFTSSNRGINFLRYNSSNPAGNVQTIQNKTININRLPTFTSATDDAATIKGGSTVTISTISSDADSDQTLKLYVCNSTSANSSGCINSEYCSNTSASINASCSFTSETDDTTHTWYAFIYDSFNEAAATNYSGSYTTDSTPLTITIDYPENITYSTNNITASVSLVESGNWSGYCLDDCVSNVTMTRVTATYFTATMTSLSDGSHRVVFYVNDTVGNMANSSTRYFTINTTAPDTTPPVITVWSPTNGTYYTSSSVYANITLNKPVSSATYSVNGTANVSMNNVSTTNWNASISLSDGEYNITFYANDTSGNMGKSSIIYFTVDTSVPQNTTQGPSSANDTVDIICYSRWTDNLGLDYGYLEHNETGTATNSSQVSLSGTSGWINVTIAASDTNPGVIRCKAYVYDKAGLVNTSTWFVNVTDATNPVVGNMTYAPNTTDDLDPNVMVRVSANVSDNGQLSSVILQYKLTNESTWNTSTMNLVSGSMYTGNFTPTEGNWSFRINATDSYGNENVTSMTNISVYLDKSWTNTTNIPSIKSIVRTWSRVFSLGNLTINNTGDYDLNFTVTSNRTWIKFNSTNASLDFIVNKTGNITVFNVTANTTDFAVGEFPYTITINAYDALDLSLVSTSTISGTINIQNVAGPYFDVNIITYDSSVTQSQTGITLKSSVQNVGTEDATGTWLAWTLPSEWSVASGTANVSAGFLGIGETVYNSISVDLSSSADTGQQTLMTNASCLEGVTDSDNKTVTVSGVGVTTVPQTVSGGEGWVGGGEIAAPKTEKIEIWKTIEIVRGKEDSFTIDVVNTFKDSVLEDLTLDVKGFLAQYISIEPGSFSGVEYGETRNFTVKIKIPAYKDYEEYLLNATIKGKIVKKLGNATTIKNLEIKKYITLIIHEISKEEANLSLTEAEQAIKEMKENKITTKEVENLFTMMKEKLDAGKYEEAENYSKEILSIKEVAFNAYNLINEIKGSIDSYSITGSVIKSSAVLRTQSLLNLAIAAFERGDFETALERANNAKLTLSLETKEFDSALFVSKYWWSISIIVIIIGFSGIFGYKQYAKANISKKIRDLENETDNVRISMRKAQKQYFERKFSAGVYKSEMERYEKRLAELKKMIINLRHKRVTLFEPKEVIKNLNEENKEVIKVIKNLQEEYFKKRKITKETYDQQTEVLNERLTEIEDERLKLEVLTGMGKK